MAEKSGFSSSFFGGVFGSIIGIILVGVIFDKKTPAAKSVAEKAPCQCEKGKDENAALAGEKTES
jgi:hypothetical protein